jgi:hypothetical protein
MLDMQVISASRERPGDIRRGSLVALFEVDRDHQARKNFLVRYDVHQVGAQTILETLPAEDLHEFNANIVGPIEVTDEFH